MAGTRPIRAGAGRETRSALGLFLIATLFLTACSTGGGRYALLDSDGGEQAAVRFPDGAALLGVSAVDGGLSAIDDPETEPRLFLRSWEGGAGSDVDLRDDLGLDLARVLRPEADGDRVVILYQTSDKRVGVAGFTWPDP